jgi:hypothetical protein
MRKFPVISVIDLGRVAGGVNWADIKKQAQPYCPKTVEQYGATDPAKVDRPLAQQMGEACLAEMGPGKAFFAKGKIHKAIDEAFPK